MIRPLIARFLRWRAAHHDRMTRALGATVLAHQQARQWDGLGAIWRRREHHRQRRDLLTLRASALEAPRTSCCDTHDCNQGRWCPARSRR